MYDKVFTIFVEFNYRTTPAKHNSIKTELGKYFLQAHPTTQYFPYYRRFGLLPNTHALVTPTPTARQLEAVLNSLNFRVIYKDCFVIQQISIYDLQQTHKLVRETFKTLKVSRREQPRYRIRLAGAPAYFKNYHTPPSHAGIRYSDGTWEGRSLENILNRYYGKRRETRPASSPQKQGPSPSPQQATLARASPPSLNNSLVNTNNLPQATGAPTYATFASLGQCVAGQNPTSNSFVFGNTTTTTNRLTQNTLTQQTGQAQF
ncbi:hypothetical protein FGO68_gene887 [Halteria grandinella]|uniref:Uncharacterized protein n=1 Tax=Halteria grandinella TaxID=5974 RepID=A0A8J8NJZ0_HALGN|nr:hypothetical protein FGO68_gene887 [Halteria grandinella]